MATRAVLPPPLDGIGANSSPITSAILDKGAHDRPYMHTRMPGFGAENVSPSATVFAALDKLPPITEVNSPRRMRKVKTAPGTGWRTGLRLHQMPYVQQCPSRGHPRHRHALMPKRFTTRLVFAYILDHESSARTRMPSVWTNGVSQLPAVLDGFDAAADRGILVYLKQGSAPHFPGHGQAVDILCDRSRSDHLRISFKRGHAGHRRRLSGED